MKKNVLLFLFILLFNFSYSQKFDLGIRSGSNFATQNIKSIQGTKSITGLHLGVFTYIKLPLLFGIQSEIQYSMQGTKVDANTIINIDYVKIHILKRIMFNHISSILYSLSVSFENSIFYKKIVLYHNISRYNMIYHDLS